SEILDSLDHNLKIADGVLRFRIFKVDPSAPVIVPPAVTSTPGPRERSVAPREDREDREESYENTGQPAEAPADAPPGPAEVQEEAPAEAPAESHKAAEDIVPGGLDD